MGTRDIKLARSLRALGLHLPHRPSATERPEVAPARETLFGAASLCTTADRAVLSSANSGVDGAARVLTALGDGGTLTLWVRERERRAVRIALTAQQSSAGATTLRAEFPVIGCDQRGRPLIRQTKGMRLIIITGMGGAGTSTVAARTARLCAVAGRRVALLDLSGGPPPPAPEFAAHRVDPAAELAAMPALGGWLSGLARSGVARLPALVLPVLADVLALGAMEQAVSTGAFDVVVVDAPSLGVACRLLALPALVARIGDAGPRHGGGRLARALARHLIDAPLPDSDALEEVNALLERLSRLARLLDDAGTTRVHAVVRPGADLRAALGPLAFGGLPLGSVYAGIAQPLDNDERNRLAAEAQPLPLLTALPTSYHELGQPVRPMSGTRVERDGEVARLVVVLPHQTRPSLTLRQQGDQVIISSGVAERVITLPPSLSGHLCTGAAYDGAELTLTFDSSGRGP